MTRRGWLLFAAMGVIWGIPYLLIKVAVGELTPPALVFVRTGIGALVLLPIAIGRGEVRPLLTRWRWVLVFTVVELAIPWLMLSYAEQRLSSSLSGLLVAAVPFVAAVLALALGSDDRIDLRRGAGLLVGFGGVAALVGLDLAHGDPLAFVEIGIVTLGYAAGPVVIARRLSGLPAIAVIAVSLTLTSMVYAPFGLAQMPAHLPGTSVILAVSALGLVCTALAFLFFFALIAEVGPVRATVITYVNPAVALLLGVVVLGEPLTVGAAVGFALILLGSYLATSRQPAPRATQSGRSGATDPVAAP
jgi:drug/metabolite transporter (DMT)-like permease